MITLPLAMVSGALTGTGVLLQVALRRDRVTLVIWAVGVAAFMAGVANVMGGLFAEQRGLEQTVRILTSNPVMRVFGLASGASVGSLVMLRTLAIVAVVVALMSVMIVTRHTRQNEATRRAEFIGSTAVGRHAGLAAALLTAAAANGLLGLLVAGGLMTGGLGPAGALAAGAAIGAVGLAFAGVAAITAQVSESPRGATGFGAIAIGVAFLLSAAGNVMGTVSPSGVEIESGWLAWLSPIGWAQQMRPFGGDHWWVLVLFAASFVATVTVAFALERRRDIGRGMVPERRGPARAPASLLSPVGLAWRLHRGVFFGWAVGVTVFGAVFGAVSNAFDDIISEVEGASAFFARVGGAQGLTEGFFATILGLMATVIALYTVAAVLRMRSEEANGLAEPILATGVSRGQWVASHVLVATAATLALLLLTGVSAGVLVGVVMGDIPGEVASLTAAALVQAPAVLLLGGVALAVFGLAPRYAPPVSWTAFAVALVAGPMLGGLLDLPRWALAASPFTHVPEIPAEPFSLPPVLVLSVVTLALGVAGFFGFGRRDLDVQAGEGDASHGHDAVALETEAAT